jgi:organic radical activating enzyme
MKYCPDVWKSLYVEKKTNESIAFGFCCQNATEIVTDYQHLDQLREAKQQNFNNQKNALQCNNCWKIEDRNKNSRRHAIIEWFTNNQISTDNTTELISLDWNSENVCNLACITCGPKFSSRWSQEITKYSFKDQHTYSNSHNNNFWKTLDYSKLRRIYFNGGEPLLVDDHIKILTHLDKIGQLSNVEVQYNTNCTIIPNNNIMRLWSKSKLVRLYLSIDAINKEFEFIRYPASWAQVLEFIKFLNQSTVNIINDITCTVGIHNILELDNLIEWQQKYLPTNNQGDVTSINFQLVGPISHGGALLDLAGLSPELATNIYDQLTHIKTQSFWPVIKDKLVVAHGKNNWKLYLDELSIRRNLNWQLSLPKLSQSLINCQNSGI